MRDPKTGLTLSTDTSASITARDNQDYVARVINISRKPGDGNRENAEYFYDILKNPRLKRPSAKLYTASLNNCHATTPHLEIPGDVLRVFHFQKKNKNGAQGFRDKYVGIPHDYNPEVKNPADTFNIERLVLNGAFEYIVKSKRGMAKPLADSSTRLNWSLLSADAWLFSPKGAGPAHIVYCGHAADLKLETASFGQINTTSKDATNTTWYTAIKPEGNRHVCHESLESLKQWDRQRIAQKQAPTSNTDIHAAVKFESCPTFIKAIYPKKNYISSRVTAWIETTKVHQQFGYFPTLSKPDFEPYAHNEQRLDILTILARSNPRISLAQLKTNVAMPRASSATEDQKYTAQELVKDLDFAYLAVTEFSHIVMLKDLDSMFEFEKNPWFFKTILLELLYEKCQDNNPGLQIEVIYSLIAIIKSNLKFANYTYASTEELINKILNPINMHTNFLESKLYKDNKALIDLQITLHVLLIFPHKHKFIHAIIDSFISVFESSHLNIDSIPKTGASMPELSNAYTTLSSYLIKYHLKDELYNLLERDSNVLLKTEGLYLRSNLNTQFSDGLSLIHHLCLDGRLLILKKLVAGSHLNFAAIEENKTDFPGFQAIHFAAATHQWDTVDYILSLIGASDADWALLADIYGEKLYESKEASLQSLLGWIKTEKKFPNLEAHLYDHLNPAAPLPDSNKRKATADSDENRNSDHTPKCMQFNIDPFDPFDHFDPFDPMLLELEQPPLIDTDPNYLLQAMAENSEHLPLTHAHHPVEKTTFSPARTTPSLFGQSVNTSNANSAEGKASPSFPTIT